VSAPLHGSRDSFDTLALDRVELQCGLTLRDATLAYTTYGELNPEKSNAIVYPTWYSGRHWENEWLIGPGRGLDPEKYFIIVPNMLGNGLSTSPSNAAEPYDRDRFPDITMHDNVEVQHRLVTEHLGIERLALVLGWSMGAGQTYQWCVSHPEMVPKALPFCGSPRTAPHNKVFLESVRAAIEADAAWAGGRYDAQPKRGLRAAARVYAGWGFSQAFYWQEQWRSLGFTSLEDFLVGFWEGFFLDDRDANNLLTMLWTWQHADVGNTPGFRRGHRGRAALHPGQAGRDAGGEGPVLPARGRAVGQPVHRRRRGPGDPRGVGTLRGGRRQPRRHRRHRRRGHGSVAGAAGPSWSRSQCRSGWSG